MEKDKKKILFMVTKGNFGGAQRYVFDLATNLPKDKYDIVVALGEGETLEKKLQSAGIKVRKIEALGRNIHIGKDFVSFFEIVRILREERPDILHLNSSKIGGLGGLAGRLTKVPEIIFTGHGWAFMEERNFLSKTIIAILHWITILLSHKTIVVSERTREQIKIFPFTKRKITTIHNGPDTISFLSKDEARKKLLPNNGNTLWLGTIAELHKNKGLDFVIDAYSRIADEFRNTVLVIIGEGEERKKLEKAVADKNLTDRVFFVGFKADAAILLKAFDIITFTSRQENLPYVVLESGLAGLPVIATWVGGIPEIIINGESGTLVQKGDVDAIEKAIIELLADGDKRKNLGTNLHERVRENFTLSKMLKKTTSLYEKK